MKETFLIFGEDRHMAAGDWKEIVKCSFWCTSGFLLFCHWSCVLFSSVCEAPDPSWECLHKWSADLRWHVGYNWLFRLDPPSPPSTSPTFFFFCQTLQLRWNEWATSTHHGFCRWKQKMWSLRYPGEFCKWQRKWMASLPNYTWLFAIHSSLIPAEYLPSLQFWTTEFLMLLISPPADIN